VKNDNLSKSNQELLKLAEQCATENAPRFLNNFAFKRACSEFNFINEEQAAMKNILMALISPDEHYSYIDSECQEDKPAPSKVCNNNLKMRTMISSSSKENIDRVNHFIQLQIEGAKELLD